jgi:hypothetical protein
MDTVNVSSSLSTVTSTNYSPARARNFPSFSQDAITENELENVITQALVEMLNQYDTANYRTIKSEYSFYYKEASDYDSLDASRTEVKTWYYSSTNKLKAYSLVYEEKMGSSVYDPNSGSKIGRSETAIYLFSANSIGDPILAGVYNDTDTYYDFAISSKQRIVTSKCPQCGVSLNFDTGTADLTDKAKAVEQDYVTGLSTIFIDEYSALLNWLKDVEVKKNDEDYTAKEELTLGETPYSVDYTIEKSLFEKLVKGNNQ